MPNDKLTAKTSKLNYRAAQFALLAAVLGLAGYTLNLASELRATQSVVEEIQEGRQDLEVRVALKELPPSVRSRIELIASPAEWYPAPSNGANGFLANPTPREPRSQRLSMRDLQAAGAFDPTLEALCRLHLLICARATPLGSKAPSNAWPELPVMFYGNQIMYQKNNAEKLEAPVSEQERSAKEDLEQLRAFLIEWQDELLDAGILVP